MTLLLLWLLLPSHPCAVAAAESGLHWCETAPNGACVLAPHDGLPLEPEECSDIGGWYVERHTPHCEVAQ